ncbi:MAG: S66 peptidase family protein [Anaeroplasmataceae bacterium]
MKYPNFLSKNDTIFLCSPSFGCSTEPYYSRLKKAIFNLKQLGFNIIEGKYIYNQEGLLSSSSKNITDEINNAFNSNASLLLSVGGGEMMMNILDGIDFNNIAPKWFMGYSDNTNLTFLLNTICDIASIYGGCAPEFGSDYFIDYQNDQLDLLTGKKLKFKGYPMYEIESFKSETNPYTNLNLTENSKIITYPSNIISFEGRIIGGCIDVLSCLVGTKYDHVKEFNDKYDSIIWFLEACEMNIIEVSRRLIQMKLAGWFKNAKGFIFGRPCNPNDMFDKSMEDMIKYAIGDLKVPILMNVDIGHVKPQIPVLCGSIARVNAKDNNYEIEYILK